RTMPVKVTVWPGSVELSSTYILASMVLFPAAPGPPLGVYQNELGSPMVFGLNVSVDPENVADRSAVPQVLLKTKAPPWEGSSKTFMKPTQGAPGSTPTVTSAFASLLTPRRRPVASMDFQTTILVFMRGSYWFLTNGHGTRLPKSPCPHSSQSG